MIKEIWFDMDGTIADLYGVEGWLSMLEHEETTPYEQAKPMVNMQSFARTLHTVQKHGYKIGIVSWTSKTGSNVYNARVRHAKKIWLKRHLASVKFDSIDIIAYGTPKQVGRQGILFDDEEKNRTAWGEGAHDVHDIIKVLRNLE